MLLTFLYFLLWLSLSIVLSLLVTIYIELAWACPQLGVNDSQPNQVGIMDKCFEFGGNPSETIIIAFLWWLTHSFASHWLSPLLFLLTSFPPSLSPSFHFDGSPYNNYIYSPHHILLTMAFLSLYLCSCNRWCSNWSVCEGHRRSMHGCKYSIYTTLYLIKYPLSLHWQGQRIGLELTISLAFSLLLVVGMVSNDIMH